MILFAKILNLFEFEETHIGCAAELGIRTCDALHSNYSRIAAARSGSAVGFGWSCVAIVAGGIS